MHEPVATHPEYPGRRLTRPSLQGQQNLKATHLSKVRVRQERSMLKQRLPCNGFSEHVEEAKRDTNAWERRHVSWKSSRKIKMTSTAFGWALIQAASLCQVFVVSSRDLLDEFRRPPRHGGQYRVPSDR